MASGTAALLLVLLLMAAAPGGGHAALFKATVSNCTQLQAKIREYRDTMETKGGTFRVSLACPADGGRYDDCVKPDDSFAVIQALVRLSGRGRVTLQAASSKCADGDARPRLAGAGTDGARMFVLTGPGVQLELNSLILDGLSLRPGIFAENAKRLVLRKVDLQNFTASSCDAYSFLNKGCGGALLTYATPVTVEDGAFSGNTAAFSGSGGAIYAEAGTLTPGASKFFGGTILAITRTIFKGNTATEGGAIYINKVSPKAAKVLCTKCTFTANSGNCSAVQSARSDFKKPSGGAGAPLTLDLGSRKSASSFAGNINLDGSKNTVCGSAVKSPQGKVTLSKVPKSVTGLTKAAVSTQFSDFLFTQS